MAWHILRRFTRTSIFSDSSCVSLPEKLSAFLKYLQQITWHLFICQINYAASLFTLSSLTLCYLGMNLKLAQLGWVGPGKPCQESGCPSAFFPKPGQFCSTPQFQVFWFLRCFLGCVACPLNLHGRSACVEMAEQSSL